MELVILGQSVEGIKDLGNHYLIHYKIKLGPYEAEVIEAYTNEGNTNYCSCYLKIGSEYILSSQYSIKTSDKAIELIETALRKYISDKNFVEQKYS
jgi:hypothetical protein